MNTIQRLNDLRSKLETQQREFNEMQQQYEEQMAIYSKEKEYSDADLEDLRWAIERHKEQYE
jgi:hypothetical protein